MTSASALDDRTAAAVRQALSAASSGRLADACSIGERALAEGGDPPTLHAMLGGKYMWGSDNPFMSWCDDKLRLMFSYQQEAIVLKSLPAAIQKSMAETAPKAWLGV